LLLGGRVVPRGGEGLDFYTRLFAFRLCDDDNNLLIDVAHMRGANAANLQAAERNAIVAIERHRAADIFGAVSAPYGQQYTANRLARAERLTAISIVMDIDRLVAIVTSHAGYGDGARGADQIIGIELVRFGFDK